MSKDLIPSGYNYGVVKKEEEEEPTKAVDLYTFDPLAVYRSGEKVDSTFLPSYWMAILLDNDNNELLQEPVLKDCAEVRVHRDHLGDRDKIMVREMIMDSAGAMPINRWHLARFVLEEKLPNGIGAIYRLRGDNEKLIK